MDKIKNNLDYLKILSDCTKPMHNSIITSAKKDLIYTLCECVLNCMNGNINLNETTKGKLCKHKNKLRHLLKKKSTLKEKKKILIQHGGSFLPLILSTILSAFN
jgi:hypothetical protein